MSGSTHREPCNILQFRKDTNSTPLLFLDLLMINSETTIAHDEEESLSKQTQDLSVCHTTSPFLPTKELVFRTPRKRSVTIELFRLGVTVARHSLKMQAVPDQVGGLQTLLAVDHRQNAKSACSQILKKERRNHRQC